MEKLDEEQLEEYKETFAKFDKNKDGNVDAKELGFIMRWLGYNPAFNELEDMIKENGTPPSISQDGFLRMMGKKFQETDNKNDLLEAFQVFDKDGRGKVSITELRHILCNLGEKLHDDEVNQMLRQASIPETGMIDFSAFIDAMMALHAG